MIEGDTMSEHDWVQEQIAAEITGGLSAAEKERFEAHVHDCAECTAAWDDARRLDLELDSLFAPVRPGPALEERTIQALWESKSPRRKVANWRRNFAIGIAASVGFGAVGTAALQIAG